ncbi:MAG: SgcJ/EcaC family oxidoreductase [Lacibacter sp.]|nr:SgcJ/EcaC family oxidoreductase [Lacibacter sp.]
MNKKNYLLPTLCMLFAILMIGCNTTEIKPAEAAAPVAPDMGKVKTEIQTLETAWAAADNARDTNAVAAFYADDAVTLSNNKPSVSGKEAIRKDIAASLATKPAGATVAYDVTEVFGDENTVTETGKITIKDAAGKVTYTGKYMAVWVKRDGKYTCIRDISNDDAKAQ